MEDRQKIIAKLVKIKALAERGIGGEQQTAQVMYTTLKEKYKVTDAEIEKAAEAPVDISEIDLKKFWGIAFQLATVAKTFFLPVKYRPILDNDEIVLSEQCCGILKKDPMKQAQKELGGLLPVTGEMAADSRDRMTAYRMTGCNMFDGDHPKSKPLGPVEEQTVLWYIYTEVIPLMPAYGECVCGGLQCAGCETYKLTGEQRTGCKLCGFGIMYDPDRFIRLQKLEPNVVKFAFTSKKNGGLGYREVCQFLNDKCGMNIGIPDIEEGYYQKRAQAYEEKNGGDGR